MGADASLSVDAWRRARGVVLALALACLPCRAVAQVGTDGDIGPHIVLDDAPTAQGRSAPPLVDLNQRLSKLAIDEGPDGLAVNVDTSTGTRTMSAEEYLAAVRRAQLEQQSHGMLFVLFNITKPAGLAWVALGFLGQALFTFRMVLQWLASEKHKRSIVPVGFWWGSLLGGLMLLTYFVWRKDIVGIVGQSTGAFIYARNLVLIYRPQRAAVDIQRSPAPDARPNA